MEEDSRNTSTEDKNELARGSKDHKCVRTDHEAQ